MGGVDRRPKAPKAKTEARRQENGRIRQGAAASRSGWRGSALGSLFVLLILVLAVVPLGLTLWGRFPGRFRRPGFALLLLGLLSLLLLLLLTALVRLLALLLLPLLFGLLPLLLALLLLLLL
ncbi:MAG TPA: hypothetical protein VGP14_09030, partial [Casimicrobiaceae bacterium]|nr:hypothetical protein [Casimicrobiaceae bacterium]